MDFMTLKVTRGVRRVLLGLLVLSCLQSTAGETANYEAFVDTSFRIRNPFPAQSGFFIVTWYSGKVPTDPNKLVTWFNGQGSVQNHDYNIDNSTGDLLIRKVALEIEGFYTAKLFNPAAAGEKLEYNYLNVYVAPSSVNMEGLDGPVVENEQIQVTCNVPMVKPMNPTFKWSLNNNGDYIRGTTQSYFKNEDGTYRVESTLIKKFIRRDDGDSLRCEVFHEIDQSKVELDSKRIIVHYPYKVKTMEASGNELPIRGTNKRLRCQVTDQGKPMQDTVAWFKDSRTLISETKYEGLTTSMLTIRDLNVNDVGQYECRITNAAGTSTSDKMFNLEKVLYAPEIHMVCPAPINESLSAVIECNIEAEPPVDSNSIKWYYNGNVMDRVHGAIYKLDDTSRIDRGLYTCRAENNIGQASGNCTVVVNYSPTGTPVVHPANAKVATGKSLTLSCDIQDLDDGNPVATTFVWRHGGTILTHSVGSYSYTITPELVTDGGDYSCALRNVYGQSEFGKTNITVLAPITIEGDTSLRTFTPLYNDSNFNVHYDVSGTSQKLFILKNSSLDVTHNHFSKHLRVIQGVFAYGQSRAERVEWTWNLVPEYLNDCSAVNFFNGDYSFMARENDEGMSSKTALFRIVVRYPPVWGVTSKYQSSALDVSKTLHCDVCANPGDVSYTWMYDGYRLETEGPYHVITRVTAEDFGWYTCTASNEVGTSELSIVLEEKGSPHPPENLQVISKTSTTLLLRWDVAFNGGFDLQKFEVIVNDSRNEVSYDVTEDLTRSKVTFRVRGLKPRKTYRLKVRAKNSWSNIVKSYSTYDGTAGTTLDKPTFEPLTPEVKADYMMVKWLYEAPDSNRRRKRRENQAEDDKIVGLVVEYKKEGDDRYTQYPETGKIPAEDQQSKIPGTFEPAAKYHVAYKLYEGDELSLAVQPEIVPARVAVGSSNIPAIVGAIVGVILVIVLVSVLAIILVRRKRRKSPSSELDKNTVYLSAAQIYGSSGYQPVPHSASAESLPNPRPPLLIPSSAGRHDTTVRPPIPDGKPNTAVAPIKRNGLKPENPYENVTNRPYENVQNIGDVNSSQRSLYDNAQYEDFEFSKTKGIDTSAHGASRPPHLAPIPAKRHSKDRTPSPQDDPSDLLYAELLFDEYGQPKSQQPTGDPKPKIRGADEQVDYASLDFEQMKAHAGKRGSSSDTENPYSNVSDLQTFSHSQC